MDAPDDTLRTTHLRHRNRRLSKRTFIVGPLLMCSFAGCAAPRWDWWRRGEVSATVSDSDESYDHRASSPASPSDQYPQYPEEPYPQEQYPQEPYPQEQHSPYPHENAAASWQAPAESVPAEPDAEASTEDELNPTRIVAIVGEEPILVGDVIGPINQAVAEYEGKAPPEELNALRLRLLQQQLSSVVEAKLLYVAYLRWLEDQAKGKGDISQAMPKIWERVHQKFDEEELPKLMQKYEVDTAAEVDAKLRDYGWSLAKQRRFYGERNLGMAAAMEKVRDVPETTHEEMLAYYDEQRASFEFPAKVRWEQLTVRFDKFPDRESAQRAIEQMGNEVALGGAQLSAVAKRSSHGFNAENGGQYDWTTQGSLASEPLDEAIFSIPVGELSRIIEDDVGYHIVRVLERRDAGRLPFTEAQADIKKKLEEEKRKAAFQEYMAELHRVIPVWTIYDRDE